MTRDPWKFSTTGPYAHPTAGTVGHRVSCRIVDPDSGRVLRTHSNLDGAWFPTRAAARAAAVAAGVLRPPTPRAALVAAAALVVTLGALGGLVAWRDLAPDPPRVYDFPPRVDIGCSLGSGRVPLRPDRPPLSAHCQAQIDARNEWAENR